MVCIMLFAFCIVHFVIFTTQFPIRDKLNILMIALWYYVKITLLYCYISIILVFRTEKKVL